MSTTGKKTREILLIDDDPLVVKVYAERMRFEGWNVSVARDGWEACQEAKRAKFDMILLDIRMPFHDGVEVLRDIRAGEMNVDSPIYILTSLSEGDEVDDAVRLGADGVFRKANVRPDELARQIDLILNCAGSDTSLDFGAMDDSDAEGDKLDFSPAETKPELDMDRTYEVYVNPLAGDGVNLSQALGLPELYTCAGCGGQVCLVLTPVESGDGRDFLGRFICSRCQEDA
jgi:DNA-binding response OmpR family regulator